MPIHYGSRALNYYTISSPQGTQLPQAVGVAYKMKLDKLKKQTKNTNVRIMVVSQFHTLEMVQPLRVIFTPPSTLLQR